MNTLIHINNLHISYHSSGSTIDVLHGISLEVRKAQRVGIVGESGSGKSQTALSVMRLLTGRPGITKGDISCNGTDLINADENKMNSIRGHDIAIIFQDAKASLIPYLTIKEQVLDTAKSLGYDRSEKEMLELAESHLKEMNFTDPGRILSSYPNQLSGGESQRAYIMLTLLGKPSLLIADEPTSSLDPVTSMKLIELLEAICEKRNIALVLISHDLAEIVKVTDYIYVFYNGYVVEEFPAKWIRENEREPQHPYTKFLFSMFKGDAFKELRNDNSNHYSNEQLQNNSGLDGIQFGCIYANRCPLVDITDNAIRQKCISSHPELKSLDSDGKVACYAADEQETIV